MVIGLAALSGVLILLFVVMVCLICKRRIAARNAIKGIDYEGEEVECRPISIPFLFSITGIPNWFGQRGNRTRSRASPDQH